MTKVLLRHEGSSYVIDLDKLKTKTVREIVTEVGDDKLLVLTTAQAEAWDLDSLLDRALAPKEPSPRSQSATGTDNKPEVEFKVIRAWYEGLGDEEKAKITPEGKTLKDRGTAPWLRKAYDEAHQK